jgi:tRNA U54 and U55 pseudouridine synthase Pus10
VFVLSAKKLLVTSAPCDFVMATLQKVATGNNVDMTIPRSDVNSARIQLSFSISCLSFNSINRDAKLAKNIPNTKHFCQPKSHSEDLKLI